MPPPPDPTEIPSGAECAVCGSQRLRKRARVTQTRVHECADCGFVFCHPLVRQEAQSAGRSSIMTPEEYMEGMFAGSMALQRQADVMASGRHREYAAALGRREFRVLEVGCGAAAMARVFAERGADYHGIDIDPRAIDAARRRGITSVRHLDVFDVPLEERYDVVCASQVLEHIVQPRAFVARVHALLNPGGVLHLDIPNHRSLSAIAHMLLPLRPERFGAITVPHHLFAYHAPTLHRLARGLFDARVFTVNPDHPAWGQVADYRARHRAFYAVCAVAQARCMTVLFGTRLG
jgi:2-polyprenyl-3-methyl-5-hydroxy-6-metoxy-1,4-benzoquinol methylase